MFKKSIAVAALAAVAFLAVPAAANAIGYPPGQNATVSDSTPAPGQTVTVSFADSTFTGGEPVSFTVSGNGQPTIAALAATASVTKTASTSGAVSVAVGIPASGSGSYTVSATGVTSGTTASAVLTVAAVDADGLAYTGSTVPVLWIWVGGGALALGIAMVVILAITRRQQAARN